jgi:hypothetical protein
MSSTPVYQTFTAMSHYKLHTLLLLNTTANKPDHLTVPFYCSCNFQTHRHSAQSNTFPQITTMLQSSFNSQLQLQFSLLLLLPCSPGQLPHPPILFQDVGSTPEPPETNTIHHLITQMAINTPVTGEFKFKLQSRVIKS